MPPKAIRKTSSADLNPAKVKTFEQVAGKLTQKPAPEDPNELARREEQKRRMAENDKRREEKKQKVEQAKARHKADMEREDRLAQIAAIEEEKKAESGTGKSKAQGRHGERGPTCSNCRNR